MSSSTIVLLHTFTWFLEVALINGAKFTVVNNCTNTIWLAISGSPSLDSIGFDLPIGSTGVFKAPKGWVGRLWGRTGCNFDATGQGSCRNGDCGSGRIDCNGFDSTGITMAEFSIHRSVDSMDSYKVSLANGFNLPITIEARGGSRQHCQSTGCTEDLNRLCPAELRTESGRACQNPCKAMGTTSECGPAKYNLQLFKTACPMALIIPDDDANATFTCSAGDYVITFCPSLFSLQNDKCREPFNCGVLSNIVYPFWGGDHPEICGFPGFELTNCGGEFPQLNIDSRTYRVLGFYFWEQTLRVARHDLKESLCPSVLYNTTFDPNLFSFPQNYSYENATLYYDCIQDHSDYKMPYNDNRFTCSINRTQTLNYFVAGKASELGYNVKCKDSISIPVNQSATKALSNVSTSLNDLKNAFRQGFYIQWLNSIASCQGCVRSGGVCVYDPNSALINCNIFQPKPVEAPAIGLPIALGPTPFFHSDTGYGESGLSAVEKFLIGTALVATFIIAAAFILLCLVRRRRHKRSRSALYQDSNPNVENFLLNNAYLAPQRYEYSHIKKITKSFSDKLGQGGYGIVYKGTLPNGQLVAVKLLLESKSNGEDFINEVASISRTSHVNIVNLLGFCYEKNRRALVYEFMPNRSLDKFINPDGPINANCQLDWEILHKIALGVARGLEYLHKGCTTRIVHFDIKPQNILLDEEFCPKISDFGLAKLCEKRQSILSMAGTRGTVGYISPEVFSRNFGGVSHKSDVYSYGMMVLEMVGAKSIVGMGSIQSSGHYFPDKIYDQVIHQENKNFDGIVIGSEEEDALSRKMFLVGFWCIQTIPADRPSMSKVVDMLEGSLRSIQIPPKPYLFDLHKLERGFSPSASGNMERLKISNNVGTEQTA